jgi:hypothetical protein
MDFSGAGGELTVKTGPGAESVTLNLELGEWTVQANAYYDGILIGTGDTPFTVHGGSNSITITMSTLPGSGFLDNEDAEDFGLFAVIPEEFTIDYGTSWDTVTNAIKTGGNNKNYIINLDTDVTIPGIGAGGYTFGENVTGITVSLRGGHDLGLGEDSKNLLRIGANQSLVLRESALVGRSTNNLPLVNVFDGGTFTMRSGVISGNTNTTSLGSGGGVYVHGGGIFTMYDGIISGNSAFYGGGVYIQSGSFIMEGGEISVNSGSNGGGVHIRDGSFIMKGGEISGNTPSTFGGGVYLHSGSFTMYDGAISGNTAPSGGGGVYVQSGSFIMEDGEISGNTSSGLSSHGGGVYIGSGSFTMKDGEISGNSAKRGGGVFANNAFTKTGGVIYGDDDDTPYPGNGNATDNTATDGNTWGHAVIYGVSGPIYYYRDETLNATDNISTGDTLPADPGQTVGKWTRQP